MRRYLSEVPQSISELLEKFEPISLAEMDEVQLMNRVDTKFLLGIEKLPIILNKAIEHYRIVEINGSRVSPYSSIYFDTPDAQMYTMHHNGKLNRYKIRMRSYLDSGIAFLEIKSKNNKGRTCKNRMKISSENFQSMRLLSDEQEFLKEMSPYNSDILQPKLQNVFQRITLVDKKKTERVTLDICLNYKKIDSESFKEFNGLVVVEIKQDGAVKNNFKTYLSESGLLPVSMSKYCLGMVLVNDDIKYNQFKKKLRRINKIITQENHVTI